MPSVNEAAALRARWRSRAGSLDPRDRSGVWRFRELLPFDDYGADRHALAEGNTPLYDAPRCAAIFRRTALRLKHQGCNPTGSFKDTGMTTASPKPSTRRAHRRLRQHWQYFRESGRLCRARGRAMRDSSAARPDHSSKLAQSMDYGAIVCEIDGNFDDCMRLIQEIADDPSIYFANSINPFRIEGQKTVALN